MSEWKPKDVTLDEEAQFRSELSDRSAERILNGLKMFDAFKAEGKEGIRKRLEEMERERDEQISNDEGTTSSAVQD